jgi:protein-L-isoaspartate(D-aspartate) O-methyltransferase
VEAALDFTSARQNMVESQVRSVDVTDLQIQDAMRAIPRERLVLPARTALAYADAEVEYAEGRWLMRPRDVAKLLQAARPYAGERALAVAAPYAAAVMARMGLAVTVMDTADAAPRVQLGLEGEGVQVATGELARPEGGPYDLVVSEGAVAQIPAAWFRVLAPQGRLAAVVRTGPAGKAVVYTEAGSAYGAREVFDAAPPWLPGLAPQRAFVF